ncbi:MAG: FimB/Mfa2 family fimbrial subunit, partial [Alistipes dispar]
MKRICLQAFIGMITAWTAVSCSSEPAACGCGDDGSTIPVSFTMNTPAGEAVPYGTTRATHDEAEWTIHRLTLYVYSVDDAGRGTFLRRYATDASGDQAISIVSNGAGTYNFTLKAPVSDLKARQRFVFVANDAFDEPSPGESQDELENKLAGITLEEGHSADKLAAKGTGIAMSGIARSNSNDIVTITPGVKCEVSLRRIVARVDVQNNTPNLVIGSIELLNAAPRGYLFPHDPVAAASESYITEAMNAEVALGTTYDEQKDLKKVFYLYERHNEDGNGAEIKITYTVNSSKGEVVVPFRKTSDTKEFVDVERNTLYTVVLGNGDPVTTNEVKFSLRIEDWNVVDMDEAVDPDEDEQMKRNKALKVNMFTPFNAKSVDLGTKKINSFYDKLTVSADECPTDSYFTYTELK